MHPKQPLSPSAAAPRHGRDQLWCLKSLRQPLQGTHVSSTPPWTSSRGWGAPTHDQGTALVVPDISGQSPSTPILLGQAPACPSPCLQASPFNRDTQRSSYTTFTRKCKVSSLGCCGKKRFCLCKAPRAAQREIRRCLVRAEPPFPMEIPWSDVPPRCPTGHSKRGWPQCRGHPRGRAGPCTAHT